MKNFKSSVPVEIQNKIKEFADSVDFRDLIKGHQSYGFECEQGLSEIEGNHVSGWIPHQDGGFSISQYCQCDEDSSYHFTEKQTEFMHESAKHCFDSFLSDNDLEAETEYDDLTEEQQERLFEYEMEWMDSALLELQIFVEGYQTYSIWGNDETTVTIRLSINYKDAPYYREKYAEDIKVMVLDIDEFLAMPNEEILKQFEI